MDVALTVIAIVSAIIGLTAAWWALHKAKGQAERACDERLRAYREEAEHYAAELHRLRIRFHVDPEERDET